MIHRTCLALFSISILLPVACEIPSDERPRARVSMTRAEVLAALGEPTRKSTISKQAAPIFGPPEEWWHELEMGESVEIWSWVVPGDGTYSVYFLRGEPTVSHLSFSEEGIVY